MVDIRYPQWRDGNQYINYPFADRAPLTNKDGVAIPRDTFDDARICVIGGGENAYLARLTLDHGQLTVVIADSTNGEVAYGTLQVSLTATNRTVYVVPPVPHGYVKDPKRYYTSDPRGYYVGAYFDLPTSSSSSVETTDFEALPLYDKYARPAGVLVTSPDRLLALAGRLDEGDAVFTPEQTPFVASVVTPLPNIGVRGVQLDDGAVLTGKVWLVGGRGVVLRYESGKIRVDVVGDAYAATRECAASGAIKPLPGGVKTINGIPPDANGDFKLLQGANLSSDPAYRISMGSDGTVQLKLLGPLLGVTNGGA